MPDPVIPIDELVMSAFGARLSNHSDGPVQFVHDETSIALFLAGHLMRSAAMKAYKSVAMDSLSRLRKSGRLEVDGLGWHRLRQEVYIHAS